jgi:hypothetical protein
VLRHRYVYNNVAGRQVNRGLKSGSGVTVCESPVESLKVSTESTPATNFIKNYYLSVTYR